MFDFTTLCPAWGQEAPMWENLRRQGYDNPDVIDFGVAEMKFDLAPAIRSTVTAQAQRGTFGYGMPSERYFQAVNAWMQRRHGWKTEAEWCIPTYGLVSAIGYSLRAMTEPGDGVMVLFPSYGPFFRTVADCGRTLVRSDLVLESGRYVMDFQDIEKKLADPNTKLLIFCNPHNPTGRVWSREELEKLGQLCLTYGVGIISDEIHFDLVFRPNVHTVFASVSPEVADITVTLTAPSKTFNIAGMTVSNVLISNSELRRKVEAVISREMGHYINAFGMAACIAAYEEGEPWLEEALAVLKDNADFLRGFCTEHLPTIRFQEQEGTYLCWGDYSGLGLPDGELNALLGQKARFLSQKGTDFGEGFGQFHRVNVACPKSYLEKALNRLKEVLG